MKYTLFFLLLAVLCVRSLLTSQSANAWILIWPAVNFALMAVAYAFNKPGLVFGKTSQGKFNCFLLTVNLPWLMLTWFIFRLQIFSSSEDLCNQIKGTDIWISSYPLSRNLDKFDLVIDLTAEFLPSRQSAYICLSNLDAHTLRNYTFEEEIEGKKVLIHCANGHGRSALFTAILLLKTETVSNIEDGLNLIKTSRPLAVPNFTQRKWLLKKFTS